MSASPAAELLARAADLRERAFARVMAGHYPPSDAPVAGLMRQAYRDRDLRSYLGHLPISNKRLSSAADPELHPALQDLADIIAYEATQAFTSDYYPGVPDIHVPERHVERVMAGLQREISREAQRRGLAPVRYAILPPDRRRALAERRRYWYGAFGITPSRWRSGTWSVWRIADRPMPDIRDGA